jgi:Tol biopolymer transport system component
LLALAASCLVSCSRESERRAAVAGTAATAASGPLWELVYEREVDGAMELFVIPAGGGAERRLTNDKATDGLARWTPDGERVIFTSDRSGHPQLWQVAAEGGEPRPLRQNGATEYQADVSPDGTTLALLSNIDGPERLLLQDLRSGAVRELVRHGEDTIFGNPHWSPDGRLITYSSNHRIGHQIYVVEVATGSERRLTSLGSGGCEPRFSRDGKKVVYVSRGHLRPTSRLTEQDLASGQEAVLVDWPALNYDPVYSPDGSELAFASNITGEYQVYRQRLSDGKAWRVTFTPGDARYPDYRPPRRGSR